MVVLILTKTVTSIILTSISGGSKDELSNSSKHFKKSDFAVHFRSLPYSDNKTTVTCMSEKVLQILFFSLTSYKKVRIKFSLRIQADDFLLALWCINIVFVPKQCEIIILDVVTPRCRASFWACCNKCFILLLANFFCRFNWLR